MNDNWYEPLIKRVRARKAKLEAELAAMAKRKLSQHYEVTLFNANTKEVHLLDAAITALDQAWVASR